jgi:hypothetical protein
MFRGLAAFVLAVALLPQQPAAPTFRARIDLVQVDVVVVDKDGNPVTGMKASDFTLLDRKKPQTIATFEEIAYRRADKTAPLERRPYGWTSPAIRRGSRIASSSW